jgi:hypothetical protein
VPRRRTALPRSSRATGPRPHPGGTPLNAARRRASVYAVIHTSEYPVSITPVYLYTVHFYSHHYSLGTPSLIGATSVTH